MDPLGVEPGRNVALRGGLGFTLVEALLSIVILGFMAAVMSGLYISGLQTLDAGNERILLDSQLRSRMEFLISENFDQLAGGSETVTINGTDYTVTWTVTAADLDGDAAPEPTAKQITVTLEDRTLTAIVADHETRLGKI